MFGRFNFSRNRGVLFSRRLLVRDLVALLLERLRSSAANRVAKAAGYAHIRLKSVRTARNFYGNHGFTANGVDDAEGLVRMTKAVTRRRRRRGTMRRM
jgi:hypothetical protein